jgi:DNA invertase Pin-like site-specific DNA recombinase
MSPIIGTPSRYEVKETERKIREGLEKTYGRRSRAQAGQLRTRVLQLYQNGMTQQRIAEVVGIKRELVHHYLNRSKA